MPFRKARYNAMGRLLKLRYRRKPGNIKESVQHLCDNLSNFMEDSRKPTLGRLMTCLANVTALHHMQVQQLLNDTHTVLCGVEVGNWKNDTELDNSDDDETDEIRDSESMYSISPDEFHLSHSDEDSDEDIFPEPEVMREVRGNVSLPGISNITDIDSTSKDKSEERPLNVNVIEGDVNLSNYSDDIKMFEGIESVEEDYEMNASVDEENSINVVQPTTVTQTNESETPQHDHNKSRSDLNVSPILQNRIKKPNKYIIKKVDNETQVNFVDFSKDDNTVNPSALSEIGESDERICVVNIFKNNKSYVPCKIIVSNVNSVVYNGTFN